ncbi:DEAD/DEAH box helicase [Nanoarchaeota archaeon]
MSLFKEFDLSQELSTAISRLGITDPTEIQVKSIPHIILGKDIIGESATGSGKTLAFGCGIIENVVHNEGLQALVLTPTRELAEQVKESLKTLSDQKSLKIITAYGGVAIGPQINDLRKADVLVATPGRLLDHLSRGTVNMSKIKILVLDEADRMLDMGFIEDVEKIIQACPIKRQTLFFSATIPTQVKRLTDKYMLKPITISANKHVDPSKLKQVYYDVKKNMKLSLLIHLLENESSGLIMVFCNTRSNTDFVVKNLKGNKIDAIAIHGGLTQNKRSRVMELFNGAKAGVLVCTDVAARGLHIENVSHIYNYDLPKDAKEYVHRIGRTARAGEEGKVINVLCDLDHDNFSRILYEHRSFSIKKVATPDLKKLAFVNTERTNDRKKGFRRGPSQNTRRWRR